MELFEWKYVKGIGLYFSKKDTFTLNNLDNIYEHYNVFNSAHLARQSMEQLYISLIVIYRTAYVYVLEVHIQYVYCTISTVHTYTV